MDSPETSKYRNPTDYFKVIFRRKKLIIIPAYVGLIVGIVACLLMPPTFEASTIILVEEEKIINPLIQNLAVSTSAQQRIESIREIVLGWNSLVDLARKLNLDRQVSDQQGFENLILGLRKNIKVSMRPPNVIVISYFGKTPQETQLVAKTLTDVLIERNVKTQTKETDVAITFITEQLAIYKRKIKESEISELQDQLRALLVDSTEEHPLVKELRGKIAIATKELNSGEYEVKGGVPAVNAATKEALEKELDRVLNQQGEGPTGGLLSQPDTGASIYKLMLMDKVDSAKARDIGVNQTIYNMLLQRLETAKITQRLETSREGTRYTVLDPARLPLSPVKPNKLVIMLLGLCIGLACGAGLAFMSEFMDQSVLDVEDAKLSFTLPLLGAIPRITTQEEIAHERSVTLTATVIGSVSGVALVIIALLIALFRGAYHV
jgi:capsular polysaccharide biosynthesis protein